jgi:hypothetical protein
VKKISLKQLATVDLGITFSRQMGGNKLIHYKIPMGQSLLGSSPEQLLLEHFYREEGEQVELEFLYPAPIQVESEIAAGTALHIKDASFILDEYPAIKKALQKRKIDAHLYQDHLVVPVSLKIKIKNIFAKPINKLIALVNKVIGSIQYKIYNIQPYDQYFGRDVEKDIAYAELLRKIKLIPSLKVAEESYIRRVHRATYLSVIYEDGEEQRAVQTLIDDLVVCHEKNLILGHTVMPSIIALADTIGSGKTQFALFCFLFLDNIKIQEMSGLSWVDMPKQMESVLGLVTAAPEGASSFLGGVSPEKKYDIEVINLADKREENLQASIEAYKESIPTVNKVAKVMDKEIKKKLKLVE